jgi:hypothetical protein
MQSKQKICAQERKMGLERTSRQTGQVVSIFKVWDMVPRSLLVVNSEKKYILCSLPEAIGSLQ